MPSRSSAIRAGRAFVELFAEDRRLVRGLRAAQRKLQAWGASVSAMGRKLFAAGAGLAAPILAAAGGFAKAGDQLDKLSARTGITVETLSALGYAAELSGTNLETLGQAVQKMNRRIGRITAGQGSKTQVAAVEALGLSVERPQAMNPEEQFFALAEAIAGYGNQAQAAGLAQRAFGTQVDALRPMFAQGAEGIRAMRREAERLGYVMSTEDAAAAAALTDATTRLWRSLKMMAIHVGAAVAPMLTELADRAARAARYVIDLVERNRELVATAFKIAAAVAAAGAGLMLAGGLLGALGLAVGAVASTISAFGAVLGTALSAVGAILTPVGLLIAGVTALGAYFARTTGIIDQAVNRLAEGFRRLWSEATESFQGIADAMAAGDMALAGRVLWASLRMQWRKGVYAVNKLWEDAKWYFLATWNEATSWLAEKFIQIWAGMKTGFIEAIAVLKKAWHGFVLYAGNLWNAAQKSVGNAFLDVLAKLGVLDAQTAAMAKEDLDRRLNQAMAERTLDRTGAIAEAEQQRQKDLERVRGEKAAALDVLEADKRRYYEKLNKAYDADLKSAQEALDQAKAEWRSSLDAAREARAAREAIAGGGAAGAFDPGAAGEALVAAGDKFSALGTFSAFAGRSLGIGGAQERTAKATEQTAKNTKQIEEKLEGGLAFT